VKAFPDRSCPLDGNFRRNRCKIYADYRKARLRTADAGIRLAETGVFGVIQGAFSGSD
jgi:hypothetical protein